jgi:hypothetical protein
MAPRPRWSIWQSMPAWERKGLDSRRVWRHARGYTSHTTPTIRVGARSPAPHTTATRVLAATPRPPLARCRARRSDPDRTARPSARRR